MTNHKQSDAANLVDARLIDELCDPYGENANDENIMRIAAARLSALATSLSQVTTERDRLREALEPFARISSHGIFGGPMTCAKAIYEDGTDEDGARHRSRLDPSWFDRARRAISRLKEQDAGKGGVE